MVCRPGQSCRSLSSLGLVGWESPDNVVTLLLALTLERQ
jgi:hypothetical protein